MKKALCFVAVLLFLFAIVRVSTCKPAKPGSFAWVLRTEIWLMRQGVYDYGFNEGMRGPEDSEWVIACANRDDISFASNAIRIAHLEVLGGNLKDLSPLQSQTHLNYLTVSNCPVSNLKPLENLNNLSSLNLTGSAITSVDALAQLKSLIDLDISETSVSDISPLSGLKNLRYLFLSRTNVTNLLPLKCLGSLSNLDIGGTPCRDFSGIPWNNLSCLTITAQGAEPWRNSDELHGFFKGHLFFSYYPLDENTRGHFGNYSFCTLEHALRHFDEINGTNQAISEKPAEPDAPYILELVEP